MKDQNDLFTDREDAIDIFQQLYRHENEDRWPLLPILSLVGPAGYGKSLLIKQLHYYHCNMPRQPHTMLDFNREPHDLFNILGTLRNNLQRQSDEHGYTLKFPRFTILYNLLKRTEGQRDEDDDGLNSLLNDYSDLIGLIGNVHVLLGLLMFVLKLLMHFSFTRSVVRWLVAWRYKRARGKPEWRWYQDQVLKFREINLLDNASINDIVNRLYEMCVLGRSERDFLITQILPKAFLADLRYGSFEQEPWLRSEAAKRQQGPHRVVVFLDSFEVLMREAESTAKLLLEALALNEYRRRGDTDPLLLVISSEDRLPDMSREQLNQHFPSVTWPVQQRSGNLLKQWLQQVPAEDQRHAMKLHDIYFSLPLSPFLVQDTREYLLKLDRWNETQSFTEEALIEDIQRETQGNIIYLEQVATGLQTPRKRAAHTPYNLNPQPGVLTLDLLLAVSGQSDQQESMERLLRQYCKQIEERDLIRSAIPRTLTPELLSLVLGLPRSSDELEDKWQSYRHLPFILAGAEKRKHRMVFLPDVRALFLKKLQLVSSDPNNPRSRDYDHVHRLLYDYFDARIKRSTRDGGNANEHDLLESSYHALALGEYEQVITLASNLRHVPEQWARLLDVVKQVPTQCQVYTDVIHLAEDALERARLSRNTPEVVRAIVLYTWLLAAPGSDSSYVASLWHALGMAYTYLQDADPGMRQDNIAYCRQRAIHLRNGYITPSTASIPSVTGTSKGNKVIATVPPGVHIWRFSRNLLRRALSNRIALIILSTALAFTIVTPIVLLPVLARRSININTPGPIVAPPLAPGVVTHWIGTKSEPDQELIGLSDGSTPFDAQRPDASLKNQAALQWRRGNFQAAQGLLQQATKGDVNDAETLIYLQNAQIHLSGKDCTIFVVVTSIVADASEGVNNGRDNLQGAYLAQKEHNANQSETPICLYIANIGTKPDYSFDVAQQLVKAVAVNRDIKGLIGWPGIFDNPATLNAVSLLQRANIPIVSPDSYDESNFMPNVFHVAPSYQDEGRKAALYAEKNLRKNRVAIFTDPSDAYSRSLTQGFKERFEADGRQIVAVETYSSGQVDTATLAAELQNALSTQPDVIYFSCGPAEGLPLLNQLRAKAPALQMLGGDQLYPLIGFSTKSRPDFKPLMITAPAYPNSATATDVTRLYAANFDVQDPEHVRGYGYSRPDYQAILSYDAMNTLIDVYVHSLGVQSIEQALPSFVNTGAGHAEIAFTTFNELKDQSLFVLSIDNENNVTFKDI